LKDPRADGSTDDRVKKLTDYEIQKYM
jgi:dynamin 1-like protein